VNARGLAQLPLPIGGDGVGEIDLVDHDFDSRCGFPTTRSYPSMLTETVMNSLNILTDLGLMA
jgi:hypothetical protein